MHSLSLGAVLAAGILLFACSPAQKTPASVVKPVPNLAETQRITIASPTLAPSLDPQVDVSGTPRKYDVFETLVLLDDLASTVLPGIAASWTMRDATSWRLTLRPDARFHDGSSVTADDVVYSWWRANRQEMKSPIPGRLPTIENVARVSTGEVLITTKTPDPLFLKRLANFAVVPKAYIQRVGDQEFAARPIGSGPFQVQERLPDDMLVLRGWKEHPYRKPYLDEVRIRAVADTAARLDLLRTGGCDIAMQISIDSSYGLQRDGFALDVRTADTIGVWLDSIGGNGIEPGPISDTRVRQALNYAVDRQALAASVYRGLAKPAGTLFLDGVFGADPKLTPYRYDLARAKALLAEAGYPNGFETTLEVRAGSLERTNTAVFLKEAFEVIGVSLSVVEVEYAVVSNKMYKRAAIAPLYLNGSVSAATGDAEATFLWFWSGKNAWGVRYHNVEFDAAFQASREQIDTAKREVLLQRATRVLHDDPPYLALVTGVTLGARASTVGGMTSRRSDMDWNLLDTLYRTK